MRIARLLTPTLVLALLPLPLATLGRADPADSDPPSRVGRLSYLAGAVSFRPGSLDDWGQATINYPLTTGDHLWTDADARAEITVGSSAIRLGPMTAFSFLALDDRTTQIRLSEGTLNVRLRDLNDNEVFEIDTPNGAVSLLRPGTYRVDVDSTGDTTTVTVRRGQVEVTAAGSAFSVRGDEAAVVAGIDAPSYDIHDASPPSDWDDWCATRDRRWDDARSARYVSRDMIGYEDLDEHGDWRDTDPYGPVWVPRTAVVDWAPYRYGHWAWVDPWGWTWIDDAPWGFAPFHYGRWVYVDGGWAWVPGHRVRARPVYAPALVVFVGGRNWSVALAAGGSAGVAWFPLAPDEAYVPAYRVSNTYVRNVNVTNVNVTNINVTNVSVTNIKYVNRELPGAVTGVSRETFITARPIGRSAVIVPRERVAAAVVVGTAAPLTPGRQSVLAQPVNVAARRPPRPPVAVVRRSVVVRATPPQPPVPFAARQQALRAHPGRPLDETTLATLRARTPVTRANQFVRPATPPAAAAAPALKPAREGLPAARPLPAADVTPRLDNKPPAAREQDRPAARERPVRDQPPSPAPVGRPTPAPAERPTPARDERPKHVPAERPTPARDERPKHVPAERPTPAPAERPTPARDERKPMPTERAAPAERPAPAPAPTPAAKEREAERRPAAERRPEKERTAEKDTVKEKGKKPE